MTATLGFALLSNLPWLQESGHLRDWGERQGIGQGEVWFVWEGTVPRERPEGVYFDYEK